MKTQFLLRFFAFVFLLIGTQKGFSEDSDLSSSFDSNRAYEHVKNQVAFGPRPSGSTELQKTRDYLRSQLESCHLNVTEQTFENETPRGKIKFTNLIAKTSTRSFRDFFRTKPKIILASHYDTKWFQDIKFVGANDGGSSTGVLLEIARVIANQGFSLKSADLEFVFFDGEEAVKSFTDTDGLYGSRYYVSQIKNPAESIQGIVLMDMIGDQNLLVRIPQGDPRLSQIIFKASEKLGCREHFHLMLTGMIDDHTPFQAANVPAVDLIDFDYGLLNRYWHTTEDSLDKISPESLNIVGKTVLKFLEIYDDQH